MSDAVVWILLIFLLALIPAIISLFAIRKAKQRFHRRMRAIRQRYLYHRSLDHLPSREPPEPPPYAPRYIGDITCRYNARSPYLRCAINPCGPCEGCSSYEKQ
ncbi:MAG: DUF6464 family protein [Microcystaceae cyanobacterium]